MTATHALQHLFDVTDSSPRESVRVADDGSTATPADSLAQLAATALRPVLQVSGRAGGGAELLKA